MSKEIHYIAPLTKDVKREFNIAVDTKLAELNRCDETPYVNLYKSLYQLQKNLINALPDGYPVPMIKRG